MYLSADRLAEFDRRGALAVRRAFARALRRTPELNVSQWAARHRVIASEEGAEAGRWSNDRAPYLTEIMDCLSPSHACETVTVIKCSQVGFSQVGANFLFYAIDQAPGPAMFIQPTVDLAKSWVRQKFNPAVEATPKIRSRILEQKSRDEQGSSTMFKKFGGGFLLITGANSAAGLRSHTVRYMVKDEWDEWPSDIDGQGDPDGMADARLTVYRTHGTSKCLQGSTPTTEKTSRTLKAYEASDQRVFEMPCPHCDARQELVFENLKFNREAPYNAEYQCSDCGTLIQHHHKAAMLARGAWRATMPGPGRQPGFRIGGLISPFLTWDRIAEAFNAARGDLQKMRVFYNTVIGRAWREEGTAPAWHELQKRREDWKLRTVPPGGLVLTAGVDVQKTELRYQVKAWGPGMTSWSIDYGSIPGDTADTGHTGPWAQLEKLRTRRFPDAFGRTRGIEMMAIDAGYNTQAVYDFVKRRPGVMAVKGMPGADALVLAPAKKEETTQGGRLHRRGVTLWRVGTWRLKSEFYGLLRRLPPEAEHGDYPLGYCHFSLEHGEDFFQELTAEHLATTHKGKEKRAVLQWVETGPNHYLDTEIYARAAAEHIGVRRMTIGEWQALAAQLEVPMAAIEQDLFTTALARGATQRIDQDSRGAAAKPTQDAAVRPDPDGAPPVKTTEDAPEDEALPPKGGAYEDATQDAASRLDSAPQHPSPPAPATSRLATLDLPARERRRKRPSLQPMRSSYMQD